MKKREKILFINGSLRIGGVRRSLVNLLNNIDYTKYEVDLLLFYQGGELIEDVPKEVNFIRGNYWLKLIGMSMKEVIRSKNIGNIIVRGIIGLLSRIINNRYIFKFIFATHSLRKEYDVGIAYSHNNGIHGLYGGIYQYLIWNTNATQKVGWIHTDYRMLKNDFQWESELFELLDGIVNISKANEFAFLEKMPQYEDKCFVIYNSVIADKIKTLAKEKAANSLTKKDGYKGVSVARLDDNKAVYRVINAVAHLNDIGHKLNWIIVGDGPNMERLKKQVREKKLTERIIFVGNKKNPYPYIEQADFLCVSSIFEGMPMVVEEAFVLGKPVIVTEYAAARERINSGKNGIIVENSDDGLYRGLKEWIENPNILNEYISNAKNATNLTSSSINGFEDMIAKLKDK
ncbi:MAG TPA: glycosyltransferase [Tissierellales bacterium]|nr:glycosyltransferase [Tissierellales bacterium]